MKRIHCKFCHAKPRVQFAVTYAGHQMCQDCRWEYQAIFEGKVSKSFNEASDPLKEKNPYGISSIEKGYNGSLRMWDGYYNEEMINQMKDFKFNKIKVDRIFTEKDLEDEEQRRHERYAKMIKRQERIDGLSEDS